ncbi:cell division protein FtsQ [Dysgonomonas sp. PH5-45]|uniref:hypothetical protein n=1 Tax=unclassified Dysgonomonas TaxID=2630389 RepID=UPI0024761911|nr:MULTISPECIES: hypothetical protein [unclassified Dysgonomonas]MDH6355721.1 cell division protein FtsQ [Dysgonomonas sp. PH5-45]MDH6388618.1 cell division protein FtsQ [Dysgonomonas sp. PH5-37]
MKKVLVIVGLCLLAGYLIFAAFFFEDKPNDVVCSSFEIVQSSDTSKFIDLAEIEKTVAAKGLNPYGKQLKNINTYNIEQAILSNPFIKTTRVYITGSGAVKAEITAKHPILRVMPDSGESYYIDNEANVMPLSPHFTAYLPVATGHITRPFAQKELFQLASFLQEDSFWNAQIEQIVVGANNEIEFIPRVGNQRILFGKIENIDKKLDKLMVFYRKGLNETGWNRYNVINLKYENQVVCTNNEK